MTKRHDKSLEDRVTDLEGWLFRLTGIVTRLSLANARQQGATEEQLAQIEKDVLNPGSKDA